MLQYLYIYSEWFRPIKTSSTFTSHWANSADDTLMTCFLFFQENRIWDFMQIASIEGFFEK